MKQTIIALTLALFATAANAGLPGGIINIRPNADQVAVLTNLKIDQRQFGADVEVASVRLNTELKEIELTLVFKEMCPKGRPDQLTCMALNLEPETIVLPIVAQSVESCGSTVYVAKRDARPVDGNLQVIKLVDNRTMTCEIYIPADRMTVVTYKVTTAGFGSPVETFKSELSGEALQRAQQFVP